VQIAAFLSETGARWFWDWGGSLILTDYAGEAEILRNKAHEVGGHAMLARAPENMRASTPVFSTPSNALGKLERSVREVFDPRKVFETGRIDGVGDAD